LFHLEFTVILLSLGTNALEFDDALLVDFALRISSLTFKSLALRFGKSFSIHFIANLFPKIVINIHANSSSLTEIFQVSIQCMVYKAAKSQDKSQILAKLLLDIQAGSFANIASFHIEIPLNNHNIVELETIL
jgi:hypothetical protein